MAIVFTILHEIICYGGIVLIPYTYAKAGWTGVFIHTYTLGLLGIILDFILSPTAAKNVDRVAKEYKVPHSAVYLLMEINRTSANVLIVSLLSFFDTIDAPLPTTLDIHTILHLFACLTIYCFISEVTFTAGHIWLHHTKVGNRIHKLHHLCRNPSWTTNLLFHPLDLVVEFGGPFISMPCVHHYILQDKFSFKVAVIGLYIWFAASHSENLGLSHIEHHASLGKGLFTILGKYDWFEKWMGTKKVL